MRSVFIFSFALLLAVFSVSATTVAVPGIAGLTLPPAFERNTSLSVAGQQVWEFITAEGDRDLLAITPQVRPRSIDLLRANGFQTICRPPSGVKEILSHQHQQGITWFVVAERRVAHIVLAHGSRHLDHFRLEIGALCHPG